MAEAQRKIDSNRNSKSFAKYNYPLTPGVHNIVLVFREYNYESSQTGFVGNVTAEQRMSAAVSLPIPQNLVDNYSVKVGPYELGAIGGTVLDAMSGSGRDRLLADAKALAGAASGGDVSNVTLGGLGSTFKTASAFMGRNALDSLPGGGGISAAIDLQSGTTVNPHVALKFDGVDLKQHTFTWQLSPRNEEEAKQIRDLTYYIKSRMLPGYQNGKRDSSALGRALLTYPNLVDIYFTGLNQTYFYYFKPAMINTFTTDFTPQGLALNKGGKPSFVNLTMSLTEAQIHTRGDMDELRNAF